MSEKMTPKEVADALSWLHGKEGHFNEAGKLRAHIAAVEAERDDAKRKYLDTLEQKGEALREVERAESALSAMRQRAGDRDVLRGAWIGGCPGIDPNATVMRGVLAVARYILGEGAAMESTPAPETTTAEAFATVRRERLAPGGRKEVDEFEAALALLERRMGVQDAALEEARRLFALLHDWNHAQSPGQGLSAAMEDAVSEVERIVDAALTDAPPAFTLEDENRAMQARAADLKTLGRIARDAWDRAAAEREAVDVAEDVVPAVAAYIALGTTTLRR